MGRQGRQQACDLKAGGEGAYPAPEPGLIEQLSKGNVPSRCCCPDSKVSSSLRTGTRDMTPKNAAKRYSLNNIDMLAHSVCMRGPRNTSIQTKQHPRVQQRHMGLTHPHTAACMICNPPQVVMHEKHVARQGCLAANLTSSSGGIAGPEHFGKTCLQAFCVALASRKQEEGDRQGQK